MRRRRYLRMGYGGSGSSPAPGISYSNYWFFLLF